MSTEALKDLVRRFNAEVIEGGNRAAFEEIVARNCVNHTAPSGPAGRESIWNTFNNVLRPALSELAVVIHDQIAEGDKVTTRKSITGIHTGALMGIEPTGKPVSIDVIDIVRIVDGHYVEHWGSNNFPSVLAKLRNP